ncbi:hypothetical protein J8L98_11095 [Pseudoalteromonas sp. MMG013]|uniref:asparagine synthetase B family protein n=1 Tax=Pseudoalteromonas sp. MMG013 TaxID=2822687 RepID=UPI001B36AB65|nr:asparagine synthetase B family protein [Pseudoalteromonas sp. MMG013]MBQ4862233.1 hypothetical protein [Pseudoalteromonas sp. MMG013]
MNKKNHDLFAIVAKHRYIKPHFLENFAALLPSSFPDTDAQWWLHPDAGVAIFDPSQESENQERVSGLGQLFVNSNSTTPIDLHQPDAQQQLLSILAPSHINSLRDSSGQFAFMHWQEQSSTLTLVRDPLGQKSLYIAQSQHVWYISSSLEALLSAEGFEYEFDLESAFNYLNFGVPLPGRTLAKDITKVRAGHSICIQVGNAPCESRYFTPINYDCSATATDRVAAEITNSLTQAIDKSSHTDKAAILLSSGIDSSFIANYVKHHNSDTTLCAYTVEYQGFPELEQLNETKLAKQFAESLGIEHHSVTFDLTDVHQSLDSAFSSAEPCSAASVIPHNKLLNRIANDGYSNILSGMGADEIFGGYLKYIKYYSKVQLFESSLLNVGKFEQLLWQPELCDDNLFCGVPRFFDQSALTEYLSEPFKQWQVTGHHASFYQACLQMKSSANLFELMIAHECQHRIPDLLHSVYEPINERNGLTTWYPFLDQHLIKQVIGLGAAERFEQREEIGLDNKIVMRRIARQFLPDDVTIRPRKAYVVPLQIWLKDPEIFNRIWSAIEDSALLDAEPLIERSALGTLKDKVQTLLETHNPPSDAFKPLDQLWALATLCAWYDKWLKK